MTQKQWKMISTIISIIILIVFEVYTSFLSPARQGLQLSLVKKKQGSQQAKRDHSCR